MNVLFRMIDLTNGAVFIDGTNIANLSKHDVRSRLICVPQESYTFPGDIRANLDVDGNFSDDEVLEALDKVQLKSIIQNRGGLSGKMKPDMLSPGQAQLFSLARALLHRSMILVLDEATSRYEIPV